MAEVRETRVGDLGWSLAVGFVLKFAVILMLWRREWLPSSVATHSSIIGASLVAQLVKNWPAMWETACDPGSGRSSGVGNGLPLQYSCLENSMDSGAW